MGLMKNNKRKDYRNKLKLISELEKRIYDDSSNDCETTYNILWDWAVAKCYENENYISDWEQNLDDLKEQIIL